MQPHSRLVIESRSDVSMEPRELTAPTETPEVAEIRAAAAASLRIDGRGPAHHVFPSRLVPLVSDIRDYAASSLADERPILEGALELALRIHADFTYDPVATDVTTPVAQAFDLRRGVCQDFAQVMISGLRGWGLPAAYVSGYLRTEPAPGMPRLVGADAMHAWVAVWCGAGVGWRGLDPTNGVVTALDHVEVAFGRDYADAAPLDGVIVSAGHQTLAVSVDVSPL
jgi:transglutaminase-like putative cysteine protease